MSEKVKEVGTTCISCRTHDSVRNVQLVHCKNFSSAYVDGKVVLTECEPVLPSLAEQHSIAMNLLTRQPAQSMKKRMNVDAVDLESQISKLQ